MREARPRPPRWASAFLRRTLPRRDTARAILADLEEEFQELAETRPQAARRWYAWEAVKLAVHFSLAGLRRRLETSGAGPRASRTGHHPPRPGRDAYAAGPGTPGSGNRTRGIDFMERLVLNLRFAFRGLVRRPGFALVAILTMAVGIGANVAIFSVVNAVLLEPLPYTEPDRLMAVFEWNQPRDRPTNVANPGNFRVWREEASSFRSMSAVGLQLPATILSKGKPEEGMVQYAHPDFFQVLGMQAALGRTFRADAGEPVEGEVVLSHGYWMQRFGGDPSVVGTTVDVNGDLGEIVGVLPPDYVAFGDGTALWMSMDVLRGDQTDSGRWLWCIGRLADKATAEQATEELSVVAAGLQEQFPDFNAGWTVNPVALKDHVVGDVRDVLWFLMGAVALLLVIASVNVANLLLIRATERQKEMAVRTSLGASGSNLAGQLLTESLGIAALGAALGVALAHGGTRALAAHLPTAFSLPRVQSAGVDGTVLLMAVGVTVLTGILFGLAPGLKAAGTPPASVLNAEARGPSRRTGRVRNTLVVAEVALSLVLLSGAALLGRSLAQLLRVDPGIEPQRVLVGRVNLSGQAYDEDEPKVAFFQALMGRLADRAEIDAVGGITFLPMDGLGAGTSFYPMDRPAPRPEDRPTADIRNVAGDYFDAMGIQVVEGRPFDSRDGADGPRTAVVNQTLARLHWPDQSAIGKPLFIRWETEEPWEIVGVVEDVHLASLDQEPREVVYLSYPRTPYFSFLQIAARGPGDPADLTTVLRSEVRAMDGDLPLGNVRIMEELVSNSAATPRLTAFLMVLFASLATLLAAVGLYGVLAYAVSRRVREIGVRIAMGARSGDIVGMVVRQGGVLALVGIAVGIGAALAGARVVAGLLYQVQPSDPLSLGGAAGLLFLVAIAASAIPAWRATRIAPGDSLREE